MEKETEQEIASASVKYMLDTAGIMVCGRVAGFDVDNPEHQEMAKTLVIGLMKEDEKFKETFTQKGIKIIQTIAKEKLLKEFDWAEKERLEEKRAKLIKEFGDFLAPIVEWMIRIPEKEHRDKIRKALR